MNANWVSTIFIRYHIITFMLLSESISINNVLKYVLFYTFHIIYIHKCPTPIYIFIIKYFMPKFNQYSYEIFNLIYHPHLFQIVLFSIIFKKYMCNKYSRQLQRLHRLVKIAIYILPNITHFIYNML